MLFTIVSVVLLGLVYPAVMTLGDRNCSFRSGGRFAGRRQRKLVGSDIIGQLLTKPSYFHGRPSAAGKNGYDPTATGGTNLGPTSKKLIDATRDAIAALRKANPDATGPMPMDLVTSSAQRHRPGHQSRRGVLPGPRVAKARGRSVADVRALVERHVRPRELGFLGEPHVNVLELNLALDGQK